MAVVTGTGAALPGDADVAALLDAGVPHGAPPVDPASRLGKRGLRYKDRATQLGLCAAADALADAGLHDGTGDAFGLGVDGGSVGVVVSTNLGNVDTVCRVVATIAIDTVTGTSPMDLPNASSNVVASTIAIRYGLQGVNLTLCNGATSGLDAVWWAAVVVEAGRVDRAVVVGVETANPVVARLTGDGALLDGAVALVVEAEAAAAARGATPLGEVGGYARRGSLAAALRDGGADGGVGLWLVAGDVDSHAEAGADPAWRWGPSAARRDVARTLGACSGALGVVQCAAAARWLAAGGAGPVVATAGGDDAWATLALARVAGPARGAARAQARSARLPASAAVPR